MKIDHRHFFVCLKMRAYPNAAGVSHINVNLSYWSLLSLLNSCNGPSSSATAGRTTETDFPECQVGWLVTVPE
jgi:hypothetical protein